MMIYNHYGDRFIYNDKDYIVGETVISNDKSDYANLVGVITEIRTGSDKDTENETPDIYCDFEPPIHPCNKDKLQKSLQDSYADHTPMSEIEYAIEYAIAFDCVIMSPDMIITKRELDAKIKQPWVITEEIKLYPSCENNCYNNHHKQTYILPDKESAEQMFELLLHEIHANGFFDTWKDSEDYQIYTSPNFYNAVRDIHNKADSDSYTLKMSCLSGH